jgi:WD40 repeat protein
VNSVDWHPYKSLILSSSKDINDTLKLWDPNNSELIQDSNFHKNSIVTQCQFHPEGNTYFSLGKDNSILEYELRYKGILNKFFLPAEPTSMAIMSNGNVVVGDSSGYLTWFTAFGEVIKS